MNMRELFEKPEAVLAMCPEIRSYFIERVTNGFVEGMNRAIRAIINRAFGYRNFQDFRLKVLAEHGGSS